MVRRKNILKIGSLLVLLAITVFAILPFVKVGFILLGNGLSPAGSSPVVRATWPTHTAQISTLTPTLRWPAQRGTSYRVLLYDHAREAAEPLHEAQTDEGRLTVPGGLLQDDGSYSWQALPIDNTDARSFAGDFRTGVRVRSGDLAVSPSVYNVSPAAYKHGLTLEVEAPAEMPIEVILPPTLTAAGTGRVVMVGSFRLPVRPALYLAKLSPELLSRNSDLGTIVVRGEGVMVTIPVTFDVSEQGRFLRAVVSGFDPLLDTPTFGNFANGVLATVTRGTCLGMVLASQESYLACRPCVGEKSCWCPRLRLRSMMTPEMVRHEMNFLHLANFNPLNWSTAVTSTLTETSQPDVLGEVMARLQDGTPVPLALLERRAATEGPGLGHAVLAYAVHEFEDHTLVFVYDPDRVLHSGDALRSFILVPRGPEQNTAMVFHGIGGEEAVEVHALPDAGLLQTLSPRLAGIFSSVDQELAHGWGGR